MAQLCGRWLARGGDTRPWSGLSSPTLPQHPLSCLCVCTLMAPSCPVGPVADLPPASPHSLTFLPSIQTNAWTPAPTTSSPCPQHHMGPGSPGCPGGQRPKIKGQQILCLLPTPKEQLNICLGHQQSRAARNGRAWAEFGLPSETVKRPSQGKIQLWLDFILILR